MTLVALSGGLLSWAFSAAFTGILALLLARALRTRRASLDAAVAVFLWIWITTLITFLLGLAGLLSAFWWGVVSAAGLAALLGIPRTRAVVLQQLRGWPEAKARFVHRWGELPTWMRWISAVFLIFAAARFAILIWALPPFVWDSLTYHLTNVAQWIQDGRLALFDTPVQRIYSPANYEVLAAWFSVFLHHDVVVEAAGLPAYVVAGLSVFALGRAFRLSTLGAWAATLVYLSTPALVYAATGTKNDPFVAAVYLLVGALILHLKDSLGAEEPPVMSSLVLMVLALTYSLGTKAYTLQLAVGLAVLALAPVPGLSLRVQATRAARRLVQEVRLSRRPARALLVVLVGCGLLLGGYWNVRNWILKGNPFYPYEVAYEAQGPSVTRSGHYGLGLVRLEENLSVLGDKFGDKRSRIVPDLPETTGWGWLAYGMGLVAAAWSLLVDRRFRFLAASFAVSTLLLMASNTTSPWNMRYFVWLPALFAVGVGLFIDPIGAMDRTRRGLLGALLGFGLAMNSIMAINYNLVTMQDLTRMLALPFWERDAGRFHLRAPVEYENAYRYVPRDAVLGYNVHENGFVYPLYRADFSQRLVYVPFRPDDTCETIAGAMEARGTRYLFVAPEHTDDNLILRLRQCASTSSPIRERAPGLYVVKRDGE
jgi:hypothetical protein